MKLYKNTLKMTAGVAVVLAMGLCVANAQSAQKRTADELFTDVKIVTAGTPFKIVGFTGTQPACEAVNGSLSRLAANGTIECQKIPVGDLQSFTVTADDGSNATCGITVDGDQIYPANNCGAAGGVRVATSNPSPGTWLINLPTLAGKKQVSKMHR